MGIPAENSEDLQVLKYEVGQFYNTHHDYIPHQKKRQCGPRILTFFIYLSDVDAGGGTNFPDLDITVMPKRGRALLWPSVLDSEPSAVDNRLRHQALPVEAGRPANLAVVETLGTIVRHTCGLLPFEKRSK